MENHMDDTPQTPETPPVRRKRGRPKKAHRLVDHRPVASHAPAPEDPEPEGFDPTLINPEVHLPRPRGDRAEIFAKRLASDDPFMVRAPAIEFKDAGWVAYWANSQTRPGRISEMLNVKGWEFVHIDDLADPHTIAGMAVSPHGYVTKGPEGRSVLMRMPKESWDKLQLAKAAAIAKRTGSNAAAKAMIAEKAAKQFGDEAAEWLSHHLIGTVEEHKGPLIA